MRRRSAHVEVVVLNQQRRRRVPAARLRRVIEDAGRALRVSGEVALVLTTDAPVRRLNARYRHKDKPTDVLSFPGPHGGRFAPGVKKRRSRIHSGDAESREAGLGDIVISLDTAARNAPRFGRTLGQELQVLTLHGFLHVLGYDHETDDGTMDRLESRLRRKLLGVARERSPGQERRA
ncbi:MAG TPA: rRNA maturation RNase YbeY [Vicinamibacteria bacterium]|nr:rRNA maturation RNase YbeY [Vicinamibacteria bacterium]